MSQQLLDQSEVEKEPTTLRELLIALNDALTAVQPRTLYVTDAEMIRRIGVPQKIARDAIQALEQNPRSNFPQKSKLFGNRRYWPAVELWFQRHNGIVPHTR